MNISFNDRHVGNSHCHRDAKWRPEGWLIILALVVFANSAKAQNPDSAGGIAKEEMKDDRDSVRQQYIKGFPEYFFLYPVLKRRRLNFELAKPDRSAVLTYRPNNTYSFGLGMYVFELGIDLAFAIPLRQQSIERYGKSHARDLQLNVLAKGWGVDAFIQKYSGFYIVDNRSSDADPVPQRPDIVTKKFGLTGHYVFNSQKFSYRSSYNFSERQRSRRGSVVVLGTLSTFRVAADSSIVKSDRKVDFGSEADFTRLRYTTFSIAPGYTYTLTYNNFFVNAMLAFGPAHHWINYDVEGPAPMRHDITINSFFGARVAIGYNGERLFGGISFVSQGSNVRVADMNFSNNNSMLKVLVGYRFVEWGVLKKRVWDIVPWLD